MQEKHAGWAAQKHILQSSYSSERQISTKQVSISCDRFHPLATTVTQNFQLILKMRISLLGYSTTVIRDETNQCGIARDSASDLVDNAAYETFHIDGAVRHRTQLVAFFI
mmetsp:Transcript_15029/g.23687  ORF Transcript_15029/g.23687 Transcript_15029/m.23687 type:complete len:110 (+) Transcript_15029:57-386(+)